MAKYINLVIEYKKAFLHILVRDYIWNIELWNCEIHHVKAYEIKITFWYLYYLKVYGFK